MAKQNCFELVDNDGFDDPKSSDAPNERGRLLLRVLSRIVRERREDTDGMPDNFAR